jgi:hypothetical protein
VISKNKAQNFAIQMQKIGQILKITAQKSREERME